jgi:Glycosyltransferase family 92
MPEHYLALCAIFRDEAPYLGEWIAFHRLVGVDHFFLYDNGSTDRPETVLDPYVADGCVSVRPWPLPFHRGASRAAYTDCLERARGRVRWLAYLDLDEFLFAPRHYRLAPLLRDYEAYPGVVVRWQVYGSSGHEHACDAPVIARFSRRAPRQWVRNRRVKSIIDPARALRPLNSHHFVYRDGAMAVDEQKEPIVLWKKSRLRKRLRPLFCLLGPALRFVDPYGRTDLANRIVSVEHLRINHYPVKSRQEFRRKARLDQQAPREYEKKRYDQLDYFAYHDRNDVFDPILWRYLPALELARARVAAVSLADRAGFA